MLCRCERRRSVFQMGSSFMCFNPPSWCLVVCLRGLIFWNGKDTGETGSSISSEIQTRAYLRDYSLPEPQVSPSYHTEEYVLDPYFLSLCALFAMSSSKISLHPPSLFFLIVQFSVFSLSNFIMAWAVSQYSKHSRLFPLQWKIDYKSQVFLWSNPVLLQTKSHFFKYSKMEKEPMLCSWSSSACGLHFALNAPSSGFLSRPLCIHFISCIMIFVLLPVFSCFSLF